MKKCVVIYNPNSGKKHNNSKNILEKCKKLFDQYEYSVQLIPTKYQGHARELIKELDDDIDLVISVGGDGTFNEVTAGNLERNKRLVLSHLPYGTTNDIGTMFGMGKNPEKNLKLILNGKIRKIDLCSINNNSFVYVAGFGRFLNIAYDTPRHLKKKIGYVAYLIEGIKDFFKYATHLYDVSYQINGEKYNGLYSLVIITNANRVAGIKDFYKDVKLDDKMFEVIFCNLKTKKDILRSLIYLKTGDVTKVPGFYFYRTDKLKIKFNEKLKRPWCIDGEKLDDRSQEFVVEVIPDIEMLLPKNINKELFVNED